MNGCVEGERWEAYSYFYTLYDLCCEILGIEPEYDEKFPFAVFKGWIDFRRNFYMRLVEKFIDN